MPQGEAPPRRWPDGGAGLPPAAEEGQGHALRTRRTRRPKKPALLALQRLRLGAAGLPPLPPCGWLRCLGV